MSYYDMIVEKCDKVREEEFSRVEICHINNHFEKCFIVVAIDKFLSNWGEAENKKCYQVVLCFSQLQAEKIYSNWTNGPTFAYPVIGTLVYFVKRYFNPKKCLLTLKNANKCPAWNGSIKVEVK